MIPTLIRTYAKLNYKDEGKKDKTENVTKQHV